MRLFLRPAVLALFAIIPSLALASERPIVRISTETITPEADRSRAAVAIARERLGRGADDDFRVIGVTESLTGTHVRVKRFVEDLEVFGSDAVVSFDPRGRGELTGRRSSSAVRTGSRITASRAVAQLRSARPDLAIDEKSIRTVAIENAGETRLAYRLRARTSPLEEYDCYVDATSGDVLLALPLFFNDQAARVFRDNPVTQLNDPSLRDNRNSSTAVPAQAYSDVLLRDVELSSPLTGPLVRIIDSEAPATTPADARAPLVFDRSDVRFEEAMAYYHLDGARRYLQQLGYAGSREIFRAPLTVDAHGASGADNSYYIHGPGGNGRLVFGDGGVDDAEDPDILLHEFGHALQDSIAPSAFAGLFASEARALGEGFGDYFAFSAGYAGSLASGRDALCIGDWDARCGADATSNCAYSAGADCLRRMDSPATMRDFVRVERRGIEHQNGMIWSSALREIFIDLVSRYGLAEGRRKADTIVIESHFGVPAFPTYSLLAQKMIAADRILYGGVHGGTICSAMAGRSILAPAACGTAPRGDSMLFQSTEGDIAIPEGSYLELRKQIDVARPVGRVQVRVDIDHAVRGDLRIELVSPDGQTVVLFNQQAGDSSGLHATFGFDTLSHDSLDVFRGRPAQGVWTLRVGDFGPADRGRILSWALLLNFEGDAPITERATAAGDRTIVAVGHQDGAAGTHYVSDVSFANSSDREAELTAFFTPAGEDGRSAFAAMRIYIGPKQTVLVRDIVATLFGTRGVGQLQLRGDVDRVAVTSRTFNDAISGTFGQLIDPADPGEQIDALSGTVYAAGVRVTSGFRTNAGVSETSGNAGVVEIVLRDELGSIAETQRVTIRPWSHVQVPLATPILRGRVEFRVIEGSARIAAYASVVDQQTGDAVFVPAARMRSGRVFVPVVTHGDGAAGTKWRSDIWLSRGAAAEISGLITMRTTAGEMLTREFGFGAAQTIALDDVVRTVFGRVASGSIRIDFNGELVVASRTWTESGSGSAGQFVSTRGTPLRLAETLTVPLVEQTASFRTNIGLSERSGNAAVVRVTIRHSDGNSTSRDIAILPGVLTQMPLRDLGVAALRSGSATFELIAGEGEVFAYASVADNRSGDPVYIPAR